MAVDAHIARKIRNEFASIKIAKSYFKTNKYIPKQLFLDGPEWSSFLGGPQKRPPRAKNP